MTAHSAWSWLLSAVGLTSAWLLARHARAGWAVAIACNALWATYAVITEQWGFLAAEAAFVAVNIRGWRKWTNTTHNTTTQAGARP